MKVIPIKAAQQDAFTIPTNIRVPADSAELRTDGDDQDGLSEWEIARQAARRPRRSRRGS